MKNFTIYFPFYNQHKALKFNLDLYSSFSQDVRNKIEFLIVDDGSQKEQAFQVAKDYVDSLNLSLYKIHADIPWNQGAANNIAFKESKNDWVLRTDIDYFIKENELLGIKEAYTDGRCADEKSRVPVFHEKYVYWFWTYLAEDFPPYNIIQGWYEDGTVDDHPNTFLVHKEMYWKTGGYNEYFCGNYGDDFEFTPRLFNVATYAKLKNSIHTFSTAKENRDGQINLGKFATKDLDRSLDINMEKASDPNRPFLTFQNSYVKLI